MHTFFSVVASGRLSAPQTHETGVSDMGGTYNGQDWATHTMSRLLSNTSSLYFTARELSQQDPTGESLGEWVSEWFWDDTTGLSGLVRYAVEGTRNGMSRNEYDRIDWSAVASNLSAE